MDENEPPSGSVTIVGNHGLGQIIFMTINLEDPEGLGDVSLLVQDGQVIHYAGGVLFDDVDGVDGLKGAECIVFSHDGRHVYVAAYREDAISWYERNAKTGVLFQGALKDGINGVDGLDWARSIYMSNDGGMLMLLGILITLSVGMIETQHRRFIFCRHTKRGVDGVDGCLEVRDNLFF